MNIHAVQRLMGHADLDILLRYLDLDEADLAEAHRLYGPVDSIFGKTDTSGPDWQSEEPRERGEGDEL
jgi:hypothetical protein